MANELFATDLTSGTKYFRMYFGGQVLRADTKVLEDWSDANVAAYSITATRISTTNSYVGSVPTGAPAHDYTYELLTQAGAGAAVTDQAYCQAGGCDWDGTAVIRQSGDGYALSLSLLDYVGTCRIAGSPTASQVQFGTDASSLDNFYGGAVAKITGGTGAGQARRIGTTPGDYVGATRIANLDRDWVTPPDATSTVIVLGRIIT